MVAALLLGLAGCSGNRNGKTGVPAIESSETPRESERQAKIRHEFVVLRELVKQCALQRDAGNGDRVAAVERYLAEWLAKIPDEGANDEEREIVRRARGIVGA